MTPGRFMVMVAQLSGAPVPAPPDIPGRIVAAVIDGPDHVATAWEATHGPLTEAEDAFIQNTGRPRHPRRKSPAAPRIACASGAITRVGLVARLLQRVPRSEATPEGLWPLLRAELAAEGLEPEEVEPGQLRFNGGVITMQALTQIAIRARRSLRSEATAPPATQTSQQHRRRPGPVGTPAAGTEDHHP